MLRKDVCALYVDAKGVYPSLLYAWMDQDRDARLYSGPWPVVAHPPCAQWSKLRHLANRNPQTKSLALLAVEQVRRYGGILEHPEGSTLWKNCSLPIPSNYLGGPSDRYGFTVEVDQVSWGHAARKRTWLYCVGISRRLVLSTIRTGGKVTAWICGTYKPNLRGTLPQGIVVLPTSQRHLTPRPFAEWLIFLAATARVRSS